MSIIRQLARVANRIDSASTGTFLSKGDSTGDFTTVNYTDLSGRPTTLDSAALTSIVDSAYIQARQTSAGSGGLDSAGITALVDSNYVIARSPSASSGFAQYEYTATAGQTTFQDSDINGNVMSYTADGIFVFYNGVLIAPTTDYTATDGSTVVLTTGADSGSHVAIAKWALASSGGAGGASFSWGGDRGLFGGGSNGSTNTNVINYIDITSAGNATDFGDLTVVRNSTAAVSDATYGVWGGGGGEALRDTIDYVTISTTSNATDFGDLTSALNYPGSASDGTFGLFAGGNRSSGIGISNYIDYITIASPANATDFGDLTESRYGLCGCSNGTYGVFGGGQTPSNTIDYVTIASPANATDFGDLTLARNIPDATDDGTYGVFAGGSNSGHQNIIDYVTVDTPSNATDFGDLTESCSGPMATSNGTLGVFAGGEVNYSPWVTNIISYITISTPSNATDFGDLTAAIYRGGACSGSPS